MSVEREVADLYRLLLSRNETDETACTIALGLCRALMKSAGDEVVRETAARAIASVRIERASANDNSQTVKERDDDKLPSGR